MGRASRIPPANAPSGEEAIENYLAYERRARPLRLLKVGAVALFFGLLGSGVLYRWFVDGGVVPQMVLAGPFLLILGAVLSAVGLVGLARAR